MVLLVNASTFGCHLHLAMCLKCNLGKVNVEAMLSGSLWMQETLLQPWRFAGTLCDAYTECPALTGHMKLWASCDPCTQFVSHNQLHGSFH